MATERDNLRLETSRATAYALVDVIAVLLREEELLDAVRAFQAIVYEALGRFEAEKTRLN